MFKYFWTVVFVLLCYLGYVYGKPYYDAYNETEAIYESKDFNANELLKIKRRAFAYQILGENCKLGVSMTDGQRLSCRMDKPKHLWEMF